MWFYDEGAGLPNVSKRQCFDNIAFLHHFRNPTLSVTYRISVSSKSNKPSSMPENLGNMEAVAPPHLETIDEHCWCETGCSISLILQIN